MTQGPDKISLWLLPLITPSFLSSYLCLYTAFQRFYLLDFPLDPNKMFHTSSSSGSYFITAPFVHLIPTHLHKDPLDAMDLHPFLPRPDTVLYISLLFSPVAFLRCSVAPWCVCALDSSFQYNSSSNGTSHCHPVSTLHGPTLSSAPPPSPTPPSQRSLSSSL